MDGTLEKSGTLNDVLKNYENASRDKLIPLLQEVQDVEGYLSKDTILKVSRLLNLPASKIYGVATFYNQFRFKPLGKYHIMICRGTACHVKGSKTVLDRLCTELGVQAGETTKDGVFSLEVVACIGTCGLAPVISVNGHYHAQINPDHIGKILNSYRKEAQDGKSNEN